MRLFALCKLRVEEEDASLAGFCEFLSQVSCSGFFLHLLADKSPKEILGGFVFFCRCHIYELAEV